MVDGSFCRFPPLCPEGSTPSVTLLSLTLQGAYFPADRTFIIDIFITQKFSQQYRKLQPVFSELNAWTNPELKENTFFCPRVIYSLMLYYKVSTTLSKFPNNKPLTSSGFFPGTRSFRHIEG